MGTYAKQIVGWVQGYVKNNGGKIVQIYMSKGGVEGWIQGEFVLMFDGLFAQATNLINVHREHNVFIDHSKKADFVLEHTNVVSVIEIKCESLFKSASDSTQVDGNKFYELVKSDVDKLRSVVVTNNGAPVQVDRYVVAITVSSEAASNMGEVGVEWVDQAYFPSGEWRLGVFVADLN